MAFDFNPAEYDAPDTFEPVPEGLYQVTVLEADDKPSRAGNEMITAKLKILGPASTGRYLWWRLVNTGDYVQKNIGDMLLSMGVDVTTAISVTPQFLVGQTGHVQVEHETNEDYNDGKPSARVKYWTTAPESGAASVIPGTQGTVAIPEPQPGAPLPPQPQVTPQGEDDDIPF